MLPALRILSDPASVFVEVKFYRNFLFLLLFLCFQRLLAAVKFSTCAKLYVCVIKSHFLKDMETPFEARAGVVWGDEFYIHSPMLGIFLLP